MRTVSLGLWKTRVWCALLAGVLFLGAGAGMAQEQSAAAEESQDAAAAPAIEAPAAPESVVAPVEQETAEPPSGRDWISGRFDAGLDTVWADGESDINLNQTLKLNIDPTEHPKLHLRGLLWMNEDLDSDETSTSSLRDINDNSGSDVRARPLLLYMQADDLWGESKLRIGRQRIEEGVAWNRVDGVYFSKSLAKWDWYVFGGLRVSVYDEAWDDPVAGGGVSFRPDARTRLALDFYYGEEHRGTSDDVWVGVIPALLDWDFPRRVKQDLSDTVTSLSVWRNLTPNLNIYGRVVFQDDEVDEVALDLSGYWAGWDLSYELAYHGRFEVATDRINDVTSFYRVLGGYLEYDDLLLALHKPLSERFQLSLEAQWRDSDMEDDWNSGNRDYKRYAAILSADPLFKNSEASLAVEKWDVSGAESTWTLSGEFTQHWPARNVDFTIGADYERYEDRLTVYNAPVGIIDRALTVFVPGYYAGYNPIVLIFDQYMITMHEDIYSVYGKVRWRMCENQELHLGLTYEVDDGPDSPYWRVQAGYSIKF